MIFQCPENGCNKILDTDEESYLEHHLSSHCRKGDLWISIHDYPGKHFPGKGLVPLRNMKVLDRFFLPIVIACAITLVCTYILINYYQPHPTGQICMVNFNPHFERCF